MRLTAAAAFLAVLGTCAGESFKCGACQEVVKAIGSLVDSPVPQFAVDTIAVLVCEEKLPGQGGDHCRPGPDGSISWQCKDMCRGVVREHGREVLFLATHILLDPPEFCSSLNLCPPVNASTEPLYPAVDLASQQPVISEELPATFDVLHVSDIHLDPLYVQGTSTDCGEPVCCHRRDGPGGANTSAGTFGSTACDTPRVLLNTMMDHWATMPERPLFAVFTGDSPPHNIWDQSREFNLGASHEIAQALKRGLGSIPMFPAIGNHEAVRGGGGGSLWPPRSRPGRSAHS